MCRKITLALIFPVLFSSTASLACKGILEKFPEHTSVYLIDGRLSPQFFREFAGSADLRRLCKNYTRKYALSSACWEDLQQIVFFKLFRVETIRPETFRRLVITVVRNEAIRLAKKLTRVGGVRQTMNSDLPEYQDASLDFSTASEFFTAEEMIALESGVISLPTHYRNIIDFIYYSDPVSVRTMEEAAAHFSKTVMAIKLSLGRARERIRANLVREFPEFKEAIALTRAPSLQVPVTPESGRD